MTSIRKDDLVDLTVGDLSYGGGRGVARLDSLVVFVAGAAPAERVRARITRVEKNFAEAECIEVIQPSVWRRKPPCKYFDRCGGCSWQHISYDEQLRQKQKIFSAFFRQYPAVTFLPLIGSDNEFHYRNRVQLHKRGQTLGFHQKQSSEIVDIERCEIACDAINLSISDIRNSEFEGRIEASLLENNRVRIQPKTSQYDYPEFSQVNNDVNLKLQVALAQILECISGSQCLELYSGAGNFTSVILKKKELVKLVTVEASKVLVERAQTTIRDPRVQFITSRAEACWSQIEDVSPFELVVVDPPRTGLSSKVLEIIGRCHSKFCLYISCNPATLLRDIKILTKYGLKPIQAQAFDMFPQTEHVESLTLLAGPTAKFNFSAN